MSIPERYIMNMGVLSKEDFNKLQQSDVIIIGLGGLGGYVANQLIRLGVIKMTLVDFDIFSESNLNRQLFSNIENLGKYKADILCNELKKINPLAELNCVKKRIQDINDLKGDYIIDCVDNKETKIYLSKLSNKLNIPLLHGACGGWFGQVGWMSPSCTLLEELYGDEEKGLETELLNPPFIVGAVASFMVSEFVKMIKNDAHIVLNELLIIDLLNGIVVKSGVGKYD
jgi:molybdopterin/thiamine biosynthesis adenylyltransferase